MAKPGQRPAGHLCLADAVLMGLAYLGLRGAVAGADPRPGLAAQGPQPVDEAGGGLAMSFDFDAGKYAVYLWPAFAISAAAFVWMIADSLARPAAGGAKPSGCSPAGRGEAVKRWMAFAPLVVLIALAALFAGYALKRDPHVQPHALVGKPMPAVALPDLDTGRPAPIRARPTGPILVNFFASWCAPCEVEHPQLMA
jgi:heme exporter protein CcmD